MPNITLLLRARERPLVDPRSEIEIPTTHAVEVPYHRDLMRWVNDGTLERIARTPSVETIGAKQPETIIDDAPTDIDDDENAIARKSRKRN